MSNLTVYHEPRDYEMSILVFKLSQYSLSPSIPAFVPIQDLHVMSNHPIKARRFEPTHVWKVRGEKHLTEDVAKFLEDLKLDGAVGWFQAATGLGKSTWLLLKMASMAKQRVIVVSPFEQLIRFTGAYVRSNMSRKGFNDVKVRVHHLPIESRDLVNVNYMSAMSLLATLLRIRNFVEDHGPLFVYVDEAHVDTPEYRCLKVAASSGIFGKAAVVFSTATPEGLPSAEAHRSTDVVVQTFDPIDINSDPSRTLVGTPVLRESLSGKILVFAADHDHVSRLYDYYKRQDVYVGKFDEQMTNADLVQVLKDYSAESGTKYLITTFVLETGYTLDVDVVVDFSLKPDVGYEKDKDVFFRRLRPVYPQEAVQRAGRAGRLGPKAKVFRMKTGVVADRGYGYLRLFRVYAWMALLGLNSSLDEMIPVNKRYGKFVVRKFWNVLNCALPPVLTLEYLDQDGLPYSSLVQQLLNFYPRGWKFDCENQNVPRYVVECPFRHRLKHSSEELPIPLSPENYFLEVMVWFELGRKKPVNVVPVPGFGGDGLDSDLISRAGSSSIFGRGHARKESYDEEVLRIGRNSLPQRQQSRVSFKPRHLSIHSQYHVPYEDEVATQLPLVAEERSPVRFEPGVEFKSSNVHQDVTNVTVPRPSMVVFQAPWYVLTSVRNSRHTFVFPYLPIPAHEDDFYRPTDVELAKVKSFVRGDDAISEGSLAQIEQWFYSLIRVWNLAVVDQRQFDGQTEESWRRLRLERVPTSRSNSSSKKWSFSRKGVKVGFEDLSPLFSAVQVYGFNPCVAARGYHTPFNDPVGWLTGLFENRGIVVNSMDVSEVDETGGAVMRLMDYDVLYLIRHVHCVRMRTYVQGNFATGASYVKGDYVYLLNHVLSGRPVAPVDDMVKFRKEVSDMQGVEEPITRTPVFGERCVILCANATLTPRLEIPFEEVLLPVYSACTVTHVERRVFRVSGKSEGGLSGSPVVATSDGALLGLVHGLDVVTSDLNVCGF